MPRFPRRVTVLGRRDREHAILDRKRPPGNWIHENGITEISVPRCVCGPARRANSARGNALNPAIGCSVLVEILDKHGAKFAGWSGAWGSRCLRQCLR